MLRQAVRRRLICGFHWHGIVSSASGCCCSLCARALEQGAPDGSRACVPGSQPACSAGRAQQGWPGQAAGIPTAYISAVTPTLRSRATTVQEIEARKRSLQVARWCWAGGGPPLVAAPGPVRRAQPAGTAVTRCPAGRPPTAGCPPPSPLTRAWRWFAAHTRLAVVEEVRPTREAAKAVAQVWPVWSSRVIETM